MADKTAATADVGVGANDAEATAGDVSSSSEGYATSVSNSVGGSETTSVGNSTPCGNERRGSGSSSRGSSSRGSMQLDSLSLALQEIRTDKASPSVTSNFFEAHRLIGDSKAAGEEEEEFPDLQKPNKRSSSLKSKKTPPETPNVMKKAVRFADAFGLDLTYVKHVFDLENPPEIPPEATQDLDLDPNDEAPSEASAAPSPTSPTAPQGTLFVSPCFAQPGSSANFMARVMAQKVVLESASVGANGAICGVVRVSNVGFEKCVLLRATFDGWRSIEEVDAEYSLNSSIGLTDQFRFSLPLPPSMRVGDKVALCVMYRVNGETFWDNNFGDNYVFDCFALNQVSSAASGGTSDWPPRFP